MSVQYSCPCNRIATVIVVKIHRQFHDTILDLFLLSVHVPMVRVEVSYIQATLRCLLETINKSQLSSSKSLNRNKEEKKNWVPKKFKFENSKDPKCEPVRLLCLLLVCKMKLFSFFWLIRQYISIRMLRESFNRKTHYIGPPFSLTSIIKVFNSPTLSV